MRSFRKPVTLLAKATNSIPTDFERTKISYDILLQGVWEENTNLIKFFTELQRGIFTGSFKRKYKFNIRIEGIETFVR